MTDAPEQIWAWASGLQPAEGAFGLWSESDKWKQQRGIEYIRADLVPAMLAAERVAVIEAARAMAATGGDIRALSDDAVTAARAALVEQGRREGLEAAAALCADAANEAQDDNECGWEAAAWLMAAARSIRALIGGDDDRSRRTDHHHDPRTVGSTDRHDDSETVR